MSMLEAKAHGGDCILRLQDSPDRASWIVSFKPMGFDCSRTLEKDERKPLFPLTYRDNHDSSDMAHNEHH